MSESYDELQARKNIEMQERVKTCENDHSNRLGSCLCHTLRYNNEETRILLKHKGWTEDKINDILKPYI